VILSNTCSIAVVVRKFNNYAGDRPSYIPRIWQSSYFLIEYIYVFQSQLLNALQEADCALFYQAEGSRIFS